MKERRAFVEWVAGQCDARGDEGVKVHFDTAKRVAIRAHNEAIRECIVSLERGIRTRRAVARGHASPGCDALEIERDALRALLIEE